MGHQYTPTAGQPRVPDGRTPLWRGLIVFRVATFLYAVAWFSVQVTDYARPLVGTVEITIMAAWTAFTVVRYSRKSGRTHTLVLLDHVLINAIFLTGPFVLSHDQLASGAPSVVTLYHATLPTVAAVRWGWRGGGISAVVASSCDLLVRQYISYGTTLDVTLLLTVGIVLGVSADTARQSAERLAHALRAEATTAERERLARSIHDSVLQVLARVRRRGQELGGEAAELAQLAGEQETALRALVTAAPPESSGSGETDLAAGLGVMQNQRVSISVPGHPVAVPAAAATDLYSVVHEALENVQQHAGPQARAWVLLQDLGDELVLAIRDDGAGIPAGRLEEAAAEGRMGVAQSIRGRVANLGGTVGLDTAPDEGTEWEIRVPRSGRRDQPEHRRGGAG